MRVVYSAFGLERRVPYDQARPWGNDNFNINPPDGSEDGQRPQSKPGDNNSPLNVSGGAAWAEHFHVWRGQSKKRYICSVFPVLPQERLGGLPEFSNGICISAIFDGVKGRSRVNMFEFAWHDGVFLGDKRLVEAALAGGAREWHIHLLAVSARDKYALLEDLAVPSNRLGADKNLLRASRS
jgi:hypothetical protein